MKKVTVIFVLTFNLYNVCAQVPDFNWVKTIGESDYDVAQSVAVDTGGNVYVAGYFKGTVDLDPSTNTLPVTSIGNTDIFIAKYTPEGNLIWGFSYGSSNADQFPKVVLDHNGDLIIASYFNGTIDFDPSPNTDNHVSNVGFDAYLAEYDSDGNYLGALTFGNSATNCYLNNVAVDAQDNIYITGSFNGTIDFNPGGSGGSLNSNGASYIAKYSSTGLYEWVFPIESSTLYVPIVGLDIDYMGNVYVTGVLDGEADFNPSSTIQNTLVAFNSDIFFAKYTSLGNYVWAYSTGSWLGNIETGWHIKALSNGNIILSGVIQGVTNLNPSFVGGSFYVYTSGTSNGFLASYNSNGECLWAFALGQPSGEGIPDDLAVDASDNVYVIGGYKGIVDFNPSGDYDTLPNSMISGFVAKYNSNGVFEYAYNIGSDPYYCSPRALGVESSGDFVVVGTFAGLTDFDPSANNSSTSTNGDNDAFMVKYSQSLNSIQSSTLRIDINVFPNPTSDKLIVEAELGTNSDATVEIFNVLNQKLISYTSESSLYLEKAFDLSNLVDGIYIIRLNVNRQSVTKKFVLKKKV